MFDESGNFLMFASMVGIKGVCVCVCLGVCVRAWVCVCSSSCVQILKWIIFLAVINLVTNKCVKMIGKVQYRLSLAKLYYSHLSCLIKTLTVDARILVVLYLSLQEENVRFLQLAIHQGQVGKKTTANMVSSLTVVAHRAERTCFL